MAEQVHRLQAEFTTVREVLGAEIEDGWLQYRYKVRFVLSTERSGTYAGWQMFDDRSGHLLGELTIQVAANDTTQLVIGETPVRGVRLSEMRGPLPTTVEGLMERAAATARDAADREALRTSLESVKQLVVEDLLYELFESREIGHDGASAAEEKVAAETTAANEPIGIRARRLGRRPARLERWDRILLEYVPKGYTQERIAEIEVVSPVAIRNDFRDMRKQGLLPPAKPTPKSTP